MICWSKWHSLIYLSIRSHTCSSFIVLNFIWRMVILEAWQVLLLGLVSSMPTPIPAFCLIRSFFIDVLVFFYMHSTLFVLCVPFSLMMVERELAYNMKLCFKV